MPATRKPAMPKGLAGVVTFAQQKGGAGKTTLLAHLAAAAEEAGQRVALIDLDPQGSLLAWAEAGGRKVVKGESYRVGGDIRDAKRDADLVLIDCPGSASSMLEAAVRESDLVLVPCQPSGLDVLATAPALAMAASQKTPARVVLNRVAPRGLAAEETAALLEERGAELLKARIGNRVAYAKGIGMGVTALELAGQPRARAEIAAFAREVAKLLA